MSMGYAYRKLSVNDVGVLKELLKVFGEAFKDAPTYQHAVPSDGYLKDFLTKPHVIVLVAQEGAQVVGGLVAYVLDKFEQDRREIYIYDLAVAAPHRRRGIATALINELRGVGRTLGAYVIYVQADQGDEPAMKLYESLGTREDVHHFDIAIE